MMLLDSWAELEFSTVHHAMVWEILIQFVKVAHWTHRTRPECIPSSSLCHLWCFNTVSLDAKLPVCNFSSWCVGCVYHVAKKILRHGVHLGYWSNDMEHTEATGTPMPTTVQRHPEKTTQTPRNESWHPQLWNFCGFEGFCREHTTNWFPAFLLIWFRWTKALVRSGSFDQPLCLKFEYVCKHQEYDYSS